MGFDELGQHGMVVGEFIDKKLRTEFIPLDEGEFRVVDVDISEMESVETIIENINNIQLDMDNFYEIVLVGRKSYEIDMYSLKKSVIRNNIIKIKDKTKVSYNLEEIARDNTLKGIFVKEILSRLEDESYDEETVKKALEIGLEILEK